MNDKTNQIMCLMVFWFQNRNETKQIQTREKAKGSAEYIPAALSRYETNLSIEMTGWTDVAFVIPINNTAAYMEPIAFNISCWVPLSGWKNNYISFRFSLCQNLQKELMFWETKETCGPPTKTYLDLSILYK